MADSDPDSISITSTLPSEGRSFYNVERILAEWDDGEDLYYLVYWEGYPLEQSTWEPEDNFQQDTINDWEDTKRRIKAGQETQFDYVALERKKARIAEEKEQRKARRQKKRARLGLFKSRRTGYWVQEQALTSGDDDQVDEDAVSLESSSEEEPLQTVLRRRQSRRALEDHSSDSEASQDLPNFRRRAKKARTESQAGGSMRDVTSDGNIRKTGDGGSPTRSNYVGTMAKPKFVMDQKPQPSPGKWNTTRDSRAMPSRKLVPSKQTQLDPSKSSSKTGRSQLTSRDVLKNWQEPAKPRRPTFGENKAAISGEAPKQFQKLSIQRRVQLASMREPAPNMEALTFVNLEDGKAIPQKASSNDNETHKTPFQMIQDRLQQKVVDVAEGDTVTSLRQRSPSPMDIDPIASEPSLFVEESSMRPQSRAEQQTSIVPDASLLEGANGNATLPVRPSAHIREQAQDDESSPKISAGSLIKPEADIASLDAIRSLPEKSVTSAPYEVQARKDQNEHSLGTAVTTSNQQEYPHSSEQVQQMPAGDSNSGNSLPGSISENVTSSGNSSTAHPTEGPMIPDQLRSFLVPMAFSRLVGDYGMIKSNPAFRPNKKEYFTDMYGNLIVDEYTESNETNAIFRGLTMPAVNLILTIKEGKRLPIEIHKLCTFKEYLASYHKTGTKYYGAGHILPGKRGNVSVGQVAKRLQILGKGGLFFAKYFTILIYRTANRDWETVDRLYPPNSSFCLLRFLVRESHYPGYLTASRAIAVSGEHRVEGLSGELDIDAVLPPDSLLSHVSQRTVLPLDHLAQESKTSAVEDSQYDHSKQLGPDPSCLQTQAQTQHHFVSRISNRMAFGQQFTSEQLSLAMMNHEVEKVIELFNEQFSFDWYDMLPRRDKPGYKHEEVDVFVQYPQELQQDLKDEREFIYAFLRRVGAKRYDSDHPGDWRAFVEFVHIGIILIHESVRDFSGLTRLGHAMHRGGINVFRISLGAPYSDPQVFPKAGYTRLFPSGSDVLITDSVLLQKPQHMVRFLIWFKDYILNTKTPSTWQFFTRPKFHTWLEDMALTRTDASEGPKDLDMPYWHILTELGKFVSLEYMERHGDTPRPEAPYKSAPAIPGYNLRAGLEAKESTQEILASNEEKLVRWFGDLSLQRVQSRRKFSVLYDGPTEVTQKWKTQWPHIRFFPSEAYIAREIFKWEEDMQKKRDKRAKAKVPSTAPSDIGGKENERVQQKKG